MTTRTSTQSLGFCICIVIGAAACSSKHEDANDTATGGLAWGGSAAGFGGLAGTTGSLQTGGKQATSGVGGANMAGDSSSASSVNGGTATITAGAGGVLNDIGGAGGTTSSPSSSFTGGSSSASGGVATAAGGFRITGGSGATLTGGTSGVGGNSSTESIATAPSGGQTSQTTGCSITVTDASYSSVIGTVGIVRWSTTLAKVDKAQIDFGVDTTYGLTAPVDLNETDYRTLLLGMKQSHDPYHFRITAWSGDTPCVGADQVFASKTAFRPGALRAPTVTTQNRSALYGGYLITEGFRLSILSDYAFILDEDGEAVWWYQPADFSNSLSVAKMTHDGKAIWIAGDNIVKGTAHVARVSMDGLSSEDLSEQFQGFHHDLAILPDETVVFIAYADGDCDEIRKFTPDGIITTIVNTCQAFGNASSSHANAVRYDPYDGTVIFSDDTHSGYVKVDLEGNIKWVLNGGPSYNSFDRSGGGASGWTGNHGFQVLEDDRILFFNNGITRESADAPDAGDWAAVRELSLDTIDWTTTQVWNYTANITTPYMGDVQRLANGNTLVVFSTAGVVHEVDANGNLLQSLEWSGSSAGVGYATKRLSLYGSPPR